MTCETFQREDLKNQLTTFSSLGAKKNKMNGSNERILNVIAQAIFDKKGSNIVALDVRGVSTLTDYMVIAEGTVDRHVSSIASAILEAVKPLGITPLHIEGKDGDWVIIDLGDIFIHLLVPELREKYALESLFSEAQIVDLVIDASRKISG
ncbi:ribosome silencing factor [Parachlamydia sp. AcF125]|uniref:ribosome silencing factor n=1 Tax=Parachlamydia sp. AcF125 TaxID=2795736 RepID=UPI00201621B6|nr:ribosome silencing factor [Parachlamydia sp. AcF125]